ncbi:MAG: VWA domain-containing protein [Kofleriaceae bacterium]
MRWILLALLVRTAAADSLLSEFDAQTPIREARDLTLGPCQATVTLKGAIADITLRQVIRNPADHPHSAVFDLHLAKDATVIGAMLDEQPSTFVPTKSATQKFDTSDPLLVTMGDDLADGTQVVHAVTEPIKAQRELDLAVRWTQVAEITDSSLRVRFPARVDGSTCMIDVKAQPGPGVHVTVSQPRVTWTGEAAAEAQLSFGAQPIAWDQSEPLGDGWIAHALTVIAPAVRSDAGPRRVVLVIDASKSMELVGRGNVRRLVTAVVNALPTGSDVEAVLFDRAATRAWEKWQPIAKLGELDTVLAKHAADNGSDIAAAFALTKKLLAEPSTIRGQAMVIVVSDGVFGGTPWTEMRDALGGTKDTLDLHSLVVTPHGMSAPDGDALQHLAVEYGGSYSETAVEDLDRAMTSIASWLRPAWQDIDVPGITKIPELRAGTGQTALWIGHDPRLSFTAKGEHPVKGTVGRIAGPIGALTLARGKPPWVFVAENFSDGEGQEVMDKLAVKHPWANDARDLAVLPAKGTVALHRKQMIAAGGPYTRLVAYDDPDLTKAPAKVASATTSGGSALDKTIIKRLLNDQLEPKSYACYARELGRLNSLAGTAEFRLEIGRGEIIRASVKGFDEQPDFRACLIEAAYGLGPPAPTPGYNVDDRSVVTYPLTFKLHDGKPEVAGGADTQTPREPSVETPKHLDRGDTSTPLGGLKP